MGLLRSEDMQHATLVLPPQDAKDFIVEIGYSDDLHVQFEDMNAAAMRRPFRKYVDRIAEMERILRFMNDEFSKLDNLPPIVKNNMDKFAETEKAKYTLDKVEAELTQKYQQWIKFKENDEKLTWGRNSSEEEIAVMKFATKLSQNNGGGGLSQPLLEESLVEATAGVVEEKELDKFHKHLWRASKGKAYFSCDRENVVTVKDPKSGAEVKKAAFVVYFQTGPESALARRVKNVCLAFNANIYEWTRDRAEAEKKVQELTEDLAKNDTLLQDEKKFLEDEAMEFIAQEDEGNSKIENYRLFCKKEKSAYTILNLFTDGMTYCCEVWFPKSETDALTEKIRGVKTAGGQQAFLLPSSEDPPGIPPTYVQTNDFLEPWQGVINTYGIPSYKTANPVVVTSVTFPFIFGMMYGDIGHGSMLFFAGLFLIWRSSKPGAKYDFPLYSIRFVITQMGFFAVFAGLMYNDLFGMVSLNLFESRFDATTGQMVPGFNAENLAECGDSCQGPYPFGLDPGWHGASNELLFQNSLKMKLSVLIGVLQMLLGVFLRFGNALHENNKIDLVCECIPMLIFMVCFFGFMDIMIIYKWTHKIPGAADGPDGPDGTGFAWPDDEDGNPGSKGAPSIINSLICMGMHQVDHMPLFPGAQQMATYLMIASAISVPWLLIPKPLILKAQHQKSDKDAGSGIVTCIEKVVIWVVVPAILVHFKFLKHVAVWYAFVAILYLRDCVKGGSNVSAEEEDEETAPAVEAPAQSAHGHGHGEHFEFGEVLIHQVIETIEYVLGTISHTASYLRIWALSLAHQQLSAVFYKYTLLTAFGAASSGPTGMLTTGIAIYLAFGAWIGVTIGVLLGMDVLECFLHTLRLHWVEFQSKFYRGDGQWFTAYNIKAMLMEDN